MYWHMSTLLGTVCKNTRTLSFFLDKNPILSRSINFNFDFKLNLKQTNIIQHSFFKSYPSVHPSIR